MTTTWILTANASEAHLYQSERVKLFNGNHQLEHLQDLVNPTGRYKSSELVSDKAGFRMSKEGGSGTFVESADPHLIEMEAFAKDIADQLLQNYLSHRFQDLIIAAPPAFHGILNKHLNNQLNEAVSININKDYTHFTPQQLAEAIKKYM